MKNLIIECAEKKDRKYKDTKCENRLGICTRIKSGKTGVTEKICRCYYDLELLRATQGTSHNCDCGEIYCKYMNEQMTEKVKLHIKIPKRVRIEL